MAQQTESFPGLPPFPEDVPTAPLLRLSLQKLLTSEDAETQRLSKACEELGFFYLDLRDAGPLSQILFDADRLFQAGVDLFELPLDEKKRYDFSAQKSYFGYKAQGVGVIDRQGNLDRNEFYNVSKDDIMGISEPLPSPDVLKSNSETLKSFIKNSHSIVTLILNLLNKSLGLPDSTLANIHRLQSISGDQVRFVKAPPQPVDDRRTALGEHTDFGSVTILFNRLGGLQVLPPGDDAEWLYVRPLPGHAIVNLGDAMVKFTNGLLRSNIHRVFSPPGQQADCTRYSLVYFARPEDDVPLRRLEGSSRIPELEKGVAEEEINSKDWIIRRALGRRVDVPDIEYEAAAGTEMLSRRIKVPCSFFETPPSSPTAWSPITTPGSAQGKDVCYSPKRHTGFSTAQSREEPGPQHLAPVELERRRRAFFLAIKDVILPLTEDTQSLESLAGCEDWMPSRTHVTLTEEPARLRATLKPYQLEGLSWLLSLRNNGVGGILGDDMGLGKTLQTLSVFQHVLDSEHTPIQNDLTELWSILRWLYPEIFLPSTEKNFKDAFCLKDGKFDSGFVNSVARFLKHVMLRRIKNSPEIGLSIPPKTEFSLSVPLTESQLSWYHKILTGVDESVLLGESPDGIGQARPPNSSQAATSNPDGFRALEEIEWESQGQNAVKKRSRITTNILMELRKCSIHPYLFIDALPEDYHVGNHIVENSGKFIVLQKMIRQFVGKENRKIIIFSGFDQALSLLDGSTSSAWRNLSLFLFQNDPRYMVFLVSVRAGGEGLNLVSSSTVIFLDEDWNPQVMRQAESRVHRLGQTRPVTIFHLYAKGTVEEQMRRRLSKKAYLANRVMEEMAYDNSCASDFKEAEEEDISLMPTRDIVPTLDATQLANLDIETIMSSCAVDESSVQEMSRAEKTAWLARSERVKTNVFDGKKIDTSSRSFSVYEETILQIPRESRRIGKSRVVMIGEWEVSKESVELESLKSPTFPKSPITSKAKKINDTSRSIVCPHHSCCGCGKTASQAGRLLYSCLSCPKAFCEQCLNWDSTTFIGNDTESESKGHIAKNAFYIECVGCRRTMKRRLEQQQSACSKRARR
ncbi:hypothetical protein BJX61DRAFT_537242 [Aspergillus egyptiacus]|nr:hypothetical protein BJX61DRAFT_537242 [Aspergillus egyptiacus]